MKTEWSGGLIECSCSRPGCDGGPVSGLGVSCSPLADIAGSSLGGMSLWLMRELRKWGGGDGRLRVLARVRGGLIVGASALPCYPQIHPSPPLPHTPQGISRLFWKGPRGPFHHYTHDSLMQQAPGRCMGKDWGRRHGEVKPTSL